ncbi:alpha-amylase [Escherichia coli]|nr:alpha-amylase [Escherichia coli]EFK6384415.1 alpha-amylase [Escherichia coli]EFK6415108.1 alpha-amylase [Escherichia coli]EFL6369683.1 alpha-amylase [Escherichia coli]
MSEFARCHYGYIQIPPVTTFRTDGPETPEEEKGYWFHAYQPEDLCTIHNPMGDLQDFIALVKDAKKFGIDIIPDYTFNFMGIGGSGKNDLDYPSADIRAKISKDIEGGIPGYWQGQVLIPFIKDPVTKERKQIHPEDIHLTAKDFEATPKSDQVIMLQNQYVREMRKYGVRGLRYDAAKHSKHEQIERSITPPLKNYNERLHNTNLFNPKYHKKAVMNYMEYLVTCQLDEQQMSSLLYERDDLSAIDFSLLMKTIKAFSFGGDLQTLASKPGSTISSIPSERRILININHDFPNNGNLFNDFLFNHQQDEQLAMAYMAALPFSRPLVYWDGQVLKSTTEIKNYDGSTRVGGEAWLNKGCSTYQQLYNEFHALYIDKAGIWSAFEGIFATKNVLAFSRGDSVNINHSPHDGLVIINKGIEEVEGTWPNKLQPGIYKNMGSNSVNIIINNTRKIIPPGKVSTLRGGSLNINIPGRSALLLGKTGEPPNYLYL